MLVIMLNLSLYIVCDWMLTTEINHEPAVKSESKITVSFVDYKIIFLLKSENIGFTKKQTPLSYQKQCT